MGTWEQKELFKKSFSATATCATLFSSRQWRGGAKSGASAQHCLQVEEGGEGACVVTTVATYCSIPLLSY